jgi:hypothetical protein
MGRKPIGKRAMTSTERSRRHRGKRAGKPATKSSAALEARIVELEAELARERATKYAKPRRVKHGGGR